MKLALTIDEVAKLSNIGKGAYGASYLLSAVKSINSAKDVALDLCWGAAEYNSA